MSDQTEVGVWGMLEALVVFLWSLLLLLLGFNMYYYLLK